MSKFLALMLVLFGVVALSTPAYALDGPVVQTKVSYCQSIASDPKAVTIFGDSLTVQSLDEINYVFTSRGYKLCVNAQSGRNTGQAVPYMESMRRAGELSPRVIIALGTNDVFTRNPTLNQWYQAALGQTYPRTTCWAVGYRSTEPVGSAYVEKIVGEWDRSIDRVHSSHWGDIVKAHPEYIGPDGIHPTDDGRWVYALFLLDSLET